MNAEDDPGPRFGNPGYLAINQARLEHLAAVVTELGQLAGLSVLELGAGVGDHTQFWIDRGCRVTTSDARPVLVKRLKARYPSLDVRRIDLDLDPPPEERFDIVYAYGLLYRLADPARGLDYMAATAERMVFLETCVSYGDGHAINPVPEGTDPTQAAHGVGCRPTRPWVFDELARRFAHVYQPGVQPAHPDFPLDWNDPASARADLTRTTFIASRAPLDAPGLFPRLLNRQAVFGGAGRPAGEGLQTILRGLGVELILDVGANVGQFARARRAAGFAGAIVSFEPLPDAAAALRRGASADPLWETHELALGARRSREVLHVSANSFSSSLLPLEPRTEAAEPAVGYIEDVSVQVETLDALWPDIRARHPGGTVMLKMDVQGAEREVLQGAVNALADFALVLAECSLAPVYTGELLLADFIREMKTLGFLPVWLAPGWTDAVTGQVYQCDVAFARTYDLPRPS